jgi:HEAT repeat protein
VVAGCQADPGYAGRSSREWIAALDDSSVAVRVRATDALRRILAVKPNSPDVIRALIRALGDTVDAVRMSAGMALAAEGVRAEGAVPALHDALHDSAHAAEALGKIGPPSAAALPELRALVTDEDASVRLKAVEALLNVSRDTSALRPLMTALGDPAAHVRRAAASALGTLGTLAEPAAGALTRALSDSSAAVRAAAALALGQIGPAAGASRPALLAARRDSSAQVRRFADDALRRIEGDTSRSSVDPHGRRGLQ